MSVHIVAGEGRALDSACATADECGFQYVRIELSSVDRYNFDLSPLVVYTVSETLVFVALDNRAVNYARHKLIADVRLAGYRSFDLVSPRALLGQGARLKGNVHIGAGCNVGDGCMIGMGSWLDRNVLLGDQVSLSSCVTLLAGVRVGDASHIGVGSTLGNSAQALVGTQVGRHCEWLLPGQLPSELSDRTFFDSLLLDGAKILL